MAMNGLVNVLLARVTWCLAGCLLIAAAMPQPALANPLPEAVIYYHVQPVDPNFCTQTTVTSCPQIVQYTEATGIMEFDLFLMTAYGSELPVYGLETIVDWPWTWNLLEWEICNGGTGMVDIYYNQAILDLSWPSCPPAGELFRAMRFVVEVTGYGNFGQHDWHESWIHVECPPDVMDLSPMVASATAGVQCGYCFQPCDFHDPCHPHPTPESLELVLRQGQSVQREIDVFISGGEYPWPCPVTFVPSESWLTVDPVATDYNQWLLTVNIDATGLPLGYYEAWIRMVDECIGCTKVYLEVVDPLSAVPDDEDSEGGDQEPRLPATWGRLKALYR